MVAPCLVQLENNRTQAENAVDFNMHRSVLNLTVGDLVLVDFPKQSSTAGKRSGKLVRSFHGLFRIVKLLSPDRYNLLDLETNKAWSNVHASRTKKYIPETNYVVFS